jgi:hypothetical protein
MYHKAQSHPHTDNGYNFPLEREKTPVVFICCKSVRCYNTYDTQIVKVEE